MRIEGAPYHALPGETPPLLAHPTVVTWQAYIYRRGGTLRFDKLTMTDADLEIVNQSGADWFDFSFPGYNRQLVAGYSKNTPDHGLIVFMPDFRLLAAHR